MLKKENGVTMVMLVIMIIVMIILAGIIINEGTETIKSAKNQSIYTNMLLIQAKARTIKDKVEFGEATYVGETISEEEKSKYEINSENSRKLSQEDLYAMGVEVSGDYEYIVDYDNEEIYYAKGIKDEDKNSHYSLTDIASLGIIAEE